MYLALLFYDMVQGVIEMSQLDGTERRVLLSKVGLQKPRAIAVDPVSRLTLASYIADSLTILS